MEKKTVVFDSLFWIGFLIVLLAAWKENVIYGILGLGLQVLALVFAAITFKSTLEALKKSASQEEKPAPKPVLKTVPAPAQAPPKKSFFSLFAKHPAAKTVQQTTQTPFPKLPPAKESTIPLTPPIIPKKSKIDALRKCLFLILVFVFLGLIVWQSLHLANQSFLYYLFLGINGSILVVLFTAAKKVFKKQKSDVEYQAEQLVLQQEAAEAELQGRDLPHEKKLDLLRHHMRRFLNMNYPKSQIAEAALKAGWPEDIIEQAYLKETAEPSGVELVIKKYEINILKNYLKKAKEKYPDEMVIDAAIKMGWPERIVRDCYDELQGKKVWWEHDPEGVILPHEETTQQVLKITAKLIKHETDLDKAYNLIQEKKAVKLSEISTRFRITKKQTEDWAAILEKHGLIDIYYPLLGEPELRCKKSTATA